MLFLFSNKLFLFLSGCNPVISQLYSAAMASIFNMTGDLTAGVTSVCCNLVQGIPVSDLELAKTFELPFHPPVIVNNAPSTSFKMVFQEDKTANERTRASFRNAAYYEAMLGTRIPILLMCNVCAVFAVLKHCKQCNIHPEFCSALVVHLMFLKSEYSKKVYKGKTRYLFQTQNMSHISFFL